MLKMVKQQGVPDAVYQAHRKYELCACNEKILQVSIVEGREYKDGSHQYTIYLTVPSASSHETITLAKVRGTWAYAETRANDILGLRTAND